jgi:ABC-type lipoprotein release transport system permease subunit
MILTEAVVLGLTGAFLGTAVGVGLVLATHRSGVDYAALTGTGPSEISYGGLRWSMRLFPTLTVVDVLRVGGAVLVTSLLASAWPAARAARLQPTQAMRE